MVSGPYSLAKAATNVVVAKFHAEYAKDGVLFMSISPGFVDTGHLDTTKCKPGGRLTFNSCFACITAVELTWAWRTVTEEQQKGLASMAAQFQKYAPHFKGPITPEESVKQVISVYEKASLANGDGGSFVSHFGTKQWL